MPTHPSCRIRGAKAGVRPIGLLCGGWSETDLKKASRIAIYKDLANLLSRYADTPLAKDGPAGRY